MRTNRRKGMPTREAIKNHWFPAHFAAFGDALHGPFRDDELVADECWACGDVRRVERCHIVSIENGGPNTADNLVLLCHHCHVDSEYLSPETFWQWLRIARTTRWRPSHLHAEKRLADAGYSIAKIEKMVVALGGEETINTVFKAIGLDHTAADVRALYGKP